MPDQERKKGGGGREVEGGVIAAVTFANCAQARGKNLSGGGWCPWALFSSAGIYSPLIRRSSIVFPTSIIIFHDARLENSQIYERTSGQINMPRGCERAFGIRGIRE